MESFNIDEKEIITKNKAQTKNYVKEKGLPKNVWESEKGPKNSFKNKRYPIWQA